MYKARTYLIPFCNSIPCWMVLQDVRSENLAPRPHPQEGGGCVPPGAPAPSPYPGTQDTRWPGPDEPPLPAAVAAAGVPEAGY